MDLSIFNSLAPFDVEDIVDLLQIHRDSLQAVCYLQRHGLKIDSAYLLKIRELSYFHPVEPDFPAQSPSPESRRFPVIFDKTNVVPQSFDTEHCQTFKI